MLTGDGTAKIGDFGVAQLPGNSSRTQASRATHPGTNLYMSPEQEHTRSYLSPASDLYSSGLIIYEMATGKIYKDEFVLPASRVNRAIPKTLDAIIEKALQKEPDNRYRYAAQMQEHLEKARDGRITAEEIQLSDPAQLPIVPGPDLYFADAVTRQSVSQELAWKLKTQKPVPPTDVLYKGRSRWGIAAIGAVAAILVLGLVGLLLSGNIGNNNNSD